MRCPKVDWKTLRDLFHCVLEAAINAKQTQIQAILLCKNGKVVDYSSRLLGLVGKLENAGHSFSAV